MLNGLECKVQSAECRVQNAECGMRNAECGIPESSDSESIPKFEFRRWCTPPIEIRMTNCCHPELCEKRLASEPAKQSETHHALSSDFCRKVKKHICSVPSCIPRSEKSLKNQAKSLSAGSSDGAEAEPTRSAGLTPITWSAR